MEMVSRLMVDDKTNKMARGSLEVLARKMQNEKMRSVGRMSFLLVIDGC